MGFRSNRGCQIKSESVYSPYIAVDWMEDTDDDALIGSDDKFHSGTY